MSLKHRWNYTGRGEPKNSEKNLFDCNIVRHKSHADWPGTEPGWGSSHCLSWQSHETHRSKYRVCGQNCRAWKCWIKWCIWHQAACHNVVTITALASFTRLAEKSRDKQEFLPCRFWLRDNRGIYNSTLSFLCQITEFPAYFHTGTSCSLGT